MRRAATVPNAPRAFTLLELAICIAILSVLTPTIFWFWRSLDDQQRLAITRASAAAEVRGIGDELRRDARTRTWTPLADTGQVALAGGATCKAVVYRVDRGALFRDACGDVRALARHVQSIERSGETVTVHFALPGAVRDTPFVIGVAPGGAS